MTAGSVHPVEKTVAAVEMRTAAGSDHQWQLLQRLPSRTLIGWLRPEYQSFGERVKRLPYGSRYRTTACCAG